MIALRFQVHLQPRARALLSEIDDIRIVGKILERAESLAMEPEKRGKPLTGKMAGYRSLRAKGQRYRILYRIDRQRLLVNVVAIGIRKEGDKHDIYAIAAKWLRLGLL